MTLLHGSSRRMHALEPPPEQEGEGLDQEERNEERPEDHEDAQGELCP